LYSLRGRKEQIPIDRKVTFDEINILIKHENYSRVLKRLYFVKFRCLGDPVKETATKVGVTKKTGYYLAGLLESKLRWRTPPQATGYVRARPKFRKRKQ